MAIFHRLPHGIQFGNFSTIPDANYFPFQDGNSPILPARGRGCQEAPGHVEKLRGLPGTEKSGARFLSALCCPVVRSSQSPVPTASLKKIILIQV